MELINHSAKVKNEWNYTSILTTSILKIPHQEITDKVKHFHRFEADVTKNCMLVIIQYFFSSNVSNKAAAAKGIPNGRLRNRSSFSDTDKRFSYFSYCPDRLWIPTRLLTIVTRDSSAEVQRLRGAGDNHLHIVKKLRILYVL